MGTHHQGSKSEILALDAYIKLMRAADSITARAHLVLPDGVTLTQFAALEALYHLGPLFQSELAAKLLKSGGNLTLGGDNLELTPKGRRFIGVLFPKIAAGLTREFSVLSSRDQLALARICKRLGVGRAAPVTG